jgi:hypothetical protein
MPVMKAPEALTLITYITSITCITCITHTPRSLLLKHQPLLHHHRNVLQS